MKKSEVISGISACLIVKDEEDTLNECLKSIQPWVDEICLVDTGSSDNTLEIAAKYNARIVNFTWNDSFSEARNVSLDMARHSWVFVIDADERLTEESGPILRRIIDEDDVQAYMVFQDNKMSSGEVHSIAIPRLFRNKSEIRYSRDVHESIMDNLIRFGLGNPESSDVHLDHIGYLPEQIEKHDKNQRNKNILRKELAIHGDDLFTLYKFAQTLKDTSEGDARRSILDRAIRLASTLTTQERTQYPFIGILYSNYIDSLVIGEELSKSLSFIKQISDEVPQLPEIVWRGADLAFRIGDLGLAMNEFQRCLNLHKPDQKIPSDPRFRSIAARSRLGDIALELGDTGSFFKMIGEVTGTDPYIINCRIQRVRALLIIGDSQGAFEELETLSDESVESADVHLLKGQIALLQEQQRDAIDLLEQASDNSDSGQKARALRVMMALQAKELTKAKSLVEEIVVREAETAAMVLLVNVILGREVEVDSAFLKKYLLEKLTYWLGELVECGEQSILECFIENSKKYAMQYPGIDLLLVQE